MSDNQVLNEEEMNIVTIVDDDGTEHYFDEIDRIETDKGKYVALLEIINDDEEIVSIEDDEEEEGVIILKVLEEDGENYLVQIETEEEFNEVGTIFEDRLIEQYEKENQENQED